MTAELEDFINTKNLMGPDDYNNFDVSGWPIDASKIIFQNLL